MFKIKKQKGFTLIEMLISMAIFMTFTGILISSYTGIVRAQRDANSYRDMYVQARQVMETLVQELRDGMVDYGNINLEGNQVLRLVSRDSTTKTYVSYKDNTVSLKKRYLTDGKAPCVIDNNCYGPEKDAVNLNDVSNVEVSKFRVYFSPKIDPYDPKKVDYDTSQFQPRVTIYAEFTKDRGNEKEYTMDLQTTVSSRVYSQVYLTDPIYTNLGKY
jgi:type II secretory pathway pseudopilin PulG